MDDTKTFSDKIELPSESRLSYLLNGVGNGVMIGGIPALIYKVSERQTNTSSNKWLALIAGAGAAVGAVYGWHEGKRIHVYRQAVKDELIKQRQELEAHKEWHQKLEAEKTKPEPASAR